MNDPYGNHEFSLSAFLSDKDVMTRHKWPEEKPVERKEYLVYEKQYGNHSVAFYAEGAFWEFFGGDSYELDVIHWWELPEVTE